MSRWDDIEWDQPDSAIAKLLGVSLVRVGQVRRERGIDKCPARLGKLTLVNAMQHVAVDPATGCWEWKLSRDTAGYGQKRDDAVGRPVKAHRLFYELFREPIPPGKHVLHHCDNPPCCNPDHLFIGDDADNRLDAARKGRIPGNRKFSDETISEVRRLGPQGISHSAIAMQTGVSKCSVSRILSGEQRARS